jgi:hypothetical protein
MGTIMGGVHFCVVLSVKTLFTFTYISNEGIAF